MSDKISGTRLQVSLPCVQCADTGVFLERLPFFFSGKSSAAAATSAAAAGRFITFEDIAAWLEGIAAWLEGLTYLPARQAELSRLGYPRLCHLPRGHDPSHNDGVRATTMASGSDGHCRALWLHTTYPILGQ